MSAVPAYSYSSQRAPERTPRTRISVVPGRGSRTQTPTLPSSTVFLAKAVAIVLIVIAVVAFARVGLAAAAASASVQSQTLTSQISEARSGGAALEVSQSSLANPVRLKQEATDLNMMAPAAVGTIALSKDVIATDDTGALSLSKSVAIAAGIGA